MATPDLSVDGKLGLLEKLNHLMKTTRDNRLAFAAEVGLERPNTHASHTTITFKIERLAKLLRENGHKLPAELYAPRPPTTLMSLSNELLDSICHQTLLWQIRCDNLGPSGEHVITKIWNMDGSTRDVVRHLLRLSVNKRLRAVARKHAFSYLCFSLQCISTNPYFEAEDVPTIPVPIRGRIRNNITRFYIRVGYGAAGAGLAICLDYDRTEWATQETFRDIRDGLPSLKTGLLDIRIGLPDPETQRRELREVLEQASHLRAERYHIRYEPAMDGWNESETKNMTGRCLADLVEALMDSNEWVEVDDATISRAAREVHDACRR